MVQFEGETISHMTKIRHAALTELGWAYPSRYGAGWACALASSASFSAARRIEGRAVTRAM